MKRTSLVGSFLASLTVLFVSACMVQNAPPPVEVHDHSKGANPPATEPPASAVEPTPTPVPVATGKGADGAECQAATDCDSGVCEGLGCNVPGRCMSKNRMCTMDLQPYCGCDGKTFQSSGGCPGRRYAARGECQAAAPAPAAPPAKLADGASCAGADQCASGVCEGQGCDDKSLGKCVPETRRCTRDHAAFCGCDGQTFHGSSRCPGKRFAKKGECGK